MAEVRVDRFLDGAASREHCCLELLEITAPLRQRRWPVAKKKAARWRARMSPKLSRSDRLADLGFSFRIGQARGNRRTESVLSNQHRLLGGDTRHRAVR
jgi:hypothetical protein